MGMITKNVDFYLGEWHNVVDLAKKSSLDIRIAKEQYDNQPTYELTPNRWEYILIEQPRHKDDVISFLMALINMGNIPDSIDVIFYEGRDFFRLWWD